LYLESVLRSRSESFRTTNQQGRNGVTLEREIFRKVVDGRLAVILLKELSLIFVCLDLNGLEGWRVQLRWVVLSSSGDEVDRWPQPCLLAKQSQAAINTVSLQIHEISYPEEDINTAIILSNIPSMFCP
jgi:hypothetical protein